MNLVILKGITGKDPELNYTQSGVAVAKTSLATTEKWKDNSGEQKEKTTWHNLVIWGKLAETVEKHVPKGTHLLVEGSIDNRSYEDKDGNKRYISEIKVSSFEFCGGKKPENSNSKPRSERTNQNQEPVNPDVPEDDIPF